MVKNYFVIFRLKYYYQKISKNTLNMNIIRIKKISNLLLIKHI